MMIEPALCGDLNAEVPMKCARLFCKPAWSIVAASFVLLTMILPANASSQECLELDPTLLLDTTEHAPFLTRRALSTELLRWTDHDYLVANDGNGLVLWNIDDPASPQLLTSRQLIGYGDALLLPAAAREHNLFNVSMCDDCRYAVAHSESVASIFLDLGTGAEPSLATAMVQEGPRGMGSFTFSHNDQQYLIINNLPGGCDTGLIRPKATLFELNGIGENQQAMVSCVETTGGNSFEVYGGHYLADESGAFLYLVDSTSHVHIYEIDDSGEELALIYRSSPMVASMVNGKGLRVDVANHLAATASNFGVTLWDISDPANPSEVASWSPSTGSMNLVAIAYPYLWVGSKATQRALTYDIEDPAHPQPLHHDFWDPDEWSSFDYSAVFDAVFSRDRSTLYLARFSILSAIGFIECPPVPPTAVLGINPDIAYPDDTVTVTNLSSGPWLRSAIWVTGVGGQTVAGSSSLSESTGDTVQFTIPLQLTGNQTYTAHVAVENDDFPFDAQTPGQQLASQVIGAERRPAATIVASPAATMVGDQLTLTAEAAGSPVGDGADPYQWTISPPSGGPLQMSGQSVLVDLTMGGNWQVDLTVQYQHQVPGGGSLYQATANTVVPVFSGVDKALPAVAWVQGQGAFFVSRIDLFNTSDDPLEVVVFYTPRQGLGGDKAINVITIPGREMQVVETPLQDWFGFAQGDQLIGSVMFSVRNGDPQSLLVQSVVVAVSGSTGPIGPGAQYGQFFPALSPGEAVNEGETVYLNTTVDASRSRVNLGFLALADGTNISVRPVDPIGTQLDDGESYYLDIGGNNQVNDIHNRFGLGDADNFLVEVKVTSGMVMPYVSVLDGSVDNPGTNDPTTILPQQASSKVTLIELGTIQGIDEFTGSASITNFSELEATIQADIYLRDQHGVASSETITIAAGDTVGYKDLADDLFGITGQVGTVVLTAADGAEITATGREAAVFRDPDEEVTGTAGQLIPGMSDDELLQPGITYHLLGLRQKETVRGPERTHVAIFNPGNRFVWVTMRMYDGATGIYEEMINRKVFQQELRQINEVIEQINPLQNREYKRIEVTVDGPVFLKGFRVNQDGDPVTIDALPEP
jgi:hypothetical protein